MWRSWGWARHTPSKGCAREQHSQEPCFLLEAGSTPHFYNPTNDKAGPDESWQGYRAALPLTGQHQSLKTRSKVLWLVNLSLLLSSTFHAFLCFCDWKAGEKMVCCCIHHKKLVCSCKFQACRLEISGNWSSQGFSLIMAFNTVCGLVVILLGDGCEAGRTIETQLKHWALMWINHNNTKSSENNHWEESSNMKIRNLRGTQGRETYDKGSKT